MKKKKKKRDKSTYFRVSPRKVIGVMIAEETYDVLIQKAREAGVPLPALVRFYIEKTLGLKHPGMGGDWKLWPELETEND